MFQVNNRAALCELEHDVAAIEPRVDPGGKGNHPDVDVRLGSEIDDVAHLRGHHRSGAVRPGEALPHRGSPGKRAVSASTSTPACPTGWTPWLLWSSRRHRPPS